MNGRNHPSPRTASTQQGKHPAREELMSLLDGEISPADAGNMQHHIEGCAECRTLIERYQAVRSAFSSEDLFPELPALTATLAPLIPSATDPDSSWSTSRLWQLPSVLAASIALLAGGILFWHLVLSPPGVSARELISRVRIEEDRPLRSAPGVAVKRTLLITRRVAGVVEKRIEYQQTLQGVGGRLIPAADEAPETNSLENEIVSAIPIQNCAGLIPLSADMMECLSRDSSAALRVISTPRDLEEGVYQVAIDNLRPQQGNPFTSVWTLRLSDWRLTRVDFRFFQVPEDVEYGVEELTYLVIEEPGTSPPPPPPPLVADSRKQAISSMSRTETAEGSQESRLANTKAKLFLSLHALAPSPEDELTIRFGEGLPIVVSALVLDANRKEAFVNALDQLEGVSASVLSYSDALEVAGDHLATAPEFDAAPADRTESTIRSEGPLLLDELATHFGGGEEGRKKALSFGASVLEQSQTIQFQSRWLGRLYKALPEDELRLLSPEIRGDIMDVESAMVRHLEIQHKLLRQQVESVLCPKLCNLPSMGGLEANTNALLERTAPGPIREPAEISRILDNEFSLLKVLLVDRAFAASQPNSPSTNTATPDASSGERQIAVWLRESTRVERILSHWQPRSATPDSIRLTSR